MYKPGRHIIATLHTDEPGIIEKYNAFKEQMEQLIQQFDLTCLGQVYHDFSPRGFTGVVCLSESHVSIHTWPEYGKINVDIYLSNYERDNDGTVTQLYEAITTFFNASTEQIQTIYR